MGAVPVLARDGNDHGQNNDDRGHYHGRDHYHSAPAPLIGLGLPAVLAVGGVLLGAKFLKRRQ
jgi:hypothetical protein